MSRLRPSLRRALLITAALGSLSIAACREDELAQVVASLPATSAIPGYGLPVDVGYLNSANDAYAWGERSYGLDRVFYDTPPDYGFEYNGVQPWVWETQDDWAMYADPYGEDYRYYYYEPGDVRPYYIRDDEYGYGYDDGGRLVAIYDTLGHLMPASFLYDRRDRAGDYYWRAYDMRRHRARARPIIIQQNIWLERQPYFVDDYNPWIRAAQYEPWAEYRERNDWAVVRAFDGEARRRKYHPGFPTGGRDWAPPYLREGERRMAFRDDGRWVQDGQWQARDRNTWFSREDRRGDRQERVARDDGERRNWFGQRGRNERVRDASFRDIQTFERREADERRGERRDRTADRRALTEQVNGERRGLFGERVRPEREARAAERQARGQQVREERRGQIEQRGLPEREARSTDRQARGEQARNERRAQIEQRGRGRQGAQNAERQARGQQAQEERRAQAEQRGRGQQGARNAERQARAQQAQEERQAQAEQGGRRQQEARNVERPARVQQVQDERRAEIEQRRRGGQEARNAERQVRAQQVQEERSARAEQRGRADQEARQARTEQVQNERRAQAEQRGRAEQEARRAERQARGQQAQEQRRGEMEQRGRAQQEARQAEQQARAQQAESERQARGQQARAEREARNQQAQAERQSRQQQPQQEEAASDGGGRPDRGERPGRGRKG